MVAHPWWSAEAVKAVKARECEPGSKYDSDKLRWDLLPWRVVGQVVDVLTYGAAKYDDDNWQQVPDARNRYFAAAMRHLTAWWDGEQLDPESGRHHLAHALCCVMFLLWFDDQRGEGNGT